MKKLEPLYVCVCVGVCVIVTQSCMTLYDPMGYSPPGSSVHGILQTRILEWVTILFSSESSEPRGQTWVSCIAVGFFTIWATREAQSDLQLRSNRLEVKPTSSPWPGRTWSHRSLSASTVTTHTMEPPTPDGLADCNLILLAWASISSMMMRHGTTQCPHLYNPKWRMVKEVGS